MTTPQQRRVLVADDEESVRNLLQRSLQQAGYQVITAADGQEALNKLSTEEVEAVLLDIKMPVISGMEALRRLTAEWPDLCVIMATAVGEVETAIEAMRLGAYDYITKPFNLDDLVLRMKRAMERRDLLLQSKRYQHQLEQRVKEQAEQLQAQFSELVNTLAREHRLLYGLEVQRRKKGEVSPLSKLPPELQKPMSSAEEFRDALLKILRRL